MENLTFNVLVLTARFCVSSYAYKLLQESQSLAFGEKS